MSTWKILAGLAVLLFLQCEASHLRCFLELFRDLVLGLVVLALVKLLASLFLHGLDLVELIRAYPGDRLTHDFHLIVDFLNREESLVEALSVCAIEHELLDQSLAIFNFLLCDI